MALDTTDRRIAGRRTSLAGSQSTPRPFPTRTNAERHCAWRSVVSPRPGYAGALALASTEEGIAARPIGLHADPFLLNCRNGVLDLRTGQLSPHDPNLLLTKITGARYDPGATGGEFTKFLERIQPDQEMRHYAARVLGQALEGQVVEHILPIFHGGGANGEERRLMGAVDHALGDYANAADPQLLTTRSFDVHPTGVADLFGLRLVVSTKPKPGAGWPKPP